MRGVIYLLCIITELNKFRYVHEVISKSLENEMYKKVKHIKVVYKVILMRDNYIEVSRECCLKEQIRKI